MTFIRYLKGKAFQYTFNGFFFQFSIIRCRHLLGITTAEHFFSPLGGRLYRISVVLLWISATVDVLQNLHPQQRPDAH